jgi:transposase
MVQGRKRKSRKRRLDQVKRGTILGLKQAGRSIHKIAEEMKCERKAVRELLKKVKKHNTLDDLPRSGRPKKTTPREDRIIKRLSLTNRRATAKDIAIKQLPLYTEKKLSVSLVKDRLKSAGLPARVARKKPKLTEANRKKRYEWAKTHKDWTVDDWKKVIFSDESPFQLFQDGGKIYVRRRVGEELLDECVRPTVKHGGGTIQVWGCFSWFGAGPLYRITDTLTGVKYRQILKSNMAPYLKEIEQKSGLEVIFQHDNDPKHTSKVAKKYLENKSIVVLDWPSQMT